MELRDEKISEQLICRKKHTSGALIIATITLATNQECLML